MVYLTASLGFICCLVYDINSITIKNKVLQKGFFAGSALVVLATVFILKENAEGVRWPQALLFGAAGLLMLALLIYTLFFALPFEATYVEENRKREAYMEGVYGLCRHPGVLWYAGMYLCLAGALWSKKALVEGIFLIGWNLAYIILQDLVIFPATFSNYDVYKKCTPFLIPNGKSIKKCFHTARSGCRMK